MLFSSEHGVLRHQEETGICSVGVNANFGVNARTHNYASSVTPMSDFIMSAFYGTS